MLRGLIALKVKKKRYLQGLCLALKRGHTLALIAQTHSCQSAASHVVSRAGASQLVERATFREANNKIHWQLKLHIRVGYSRTGNKELS